MWFANLACYGGHVEIVKWLVENGAAFNAQNYSLIDDIAGACDLEIVKLLVERRS